MHLTQVFKLFTSSKTIKKQIQDRKHFFNTDARDFDILRRETTMSTPDNIFFKRKGELVCVNDFVNPFKA
ncbi:hypothetical protein FNP02_00940 [Campylobacter coli]|nr:hypothetical protein [Campylobacter coli]EDD2123829.1 hypothetical protein [Campylobacter coli]